MSISRQNLSIVIVTLRSEKVIYDCLNSIDQSIPVIIVEHSNDYLFKNKLESKYRNVRCVLSKSNLGMGKGNNIGIKEVKTDYVLILNPDTILEKNSLEEIFLASKKLAEFTILAPKEENYLNYGRLDKNLNIINLDKELNNQKEPFKVDFVDGFAMLINKKKFKDEVYFDENIFMYLENNDLCKRVIDNGESIFVIPKAKIKHLAAKTVDSKFKYEVELSRNWHWIWSKFYFNKKHLGFFWALKEGIFRFFLSTIKLLFYTITQSKNKKSVYFSRVSGFYNALLGKPSWYRPNLDD